MRGDVLDVFPPYADHPLRVEFFGDEIESVAEVDPVTGEVLGQPGQRADLAGDALRHRPRAPADAVNGIRAELQERLAQFRKAEGKLLEAQRLEMRATYDLEMLETMGFTAPASRTTRATSTAASRASRRTASSTTSRRTSSASSTRATSPCRRSAACTRATAAASSRSSSTGSGCRARSTTGRCASTSSSSASSSSSTSRPRRATTSCAYRSRRRRADHPSHRPRRPPDRWCGRPRARSTTSSTRCAHAERDERVLVTTLTKKMAEDLTDYLFEHGAARALPALRHRDARARRDPARPARGRVRRARRHQPAARGPRPSRGLARRHPRRRQGRLPAQLPVADPDDRARGAQRLRARSSCTPTR